MGACFGIWATFRKCRLILLWMALSQLAYVRDSFRFASCPRGCVGEAALPADMGRSVQWLLGCGSCLRSGCVCVCACAWVSRASGGLELCMTVGGARSGHLSVVLLQPWRRRSWAGVVQQHSQGTSLGECPLVALAGGRGRQGIPLHSAPLYGIPSQKGPSKYRWWCLARPWSLQVT